MNRHECHHINAKKKEEFLTGVRESKTAMKTIETFRKAFAFEKLHVQEAFNILKAIIDENNCTILNR